MVHCFPITATWWFGKTFASSANKAATASDPACFCSTRLSRKVWTISTSATKDKQWIYFSHIGQSSYPFFFYLLQQLIMTDCSVSWSQRTMFTWRLNWIRFKTPNTWSTCYGEIVCCYATSKQRYNWLMLVESAIFAKHFLLPTLPHWFMSMINGLIICFTS